ncbi:MAG: CaiB/BaiF CoA-transferase family protein [Rhodospirillales bacterium]|jgi:crotonobetainyl-CoA:carnitine CoA-transferase CaiB-like acyl-CoA transferase|nr:CaiB/BaiF CoA-transferase family protein [Rhodospirillales bacterium]
MDGALAGIRVFDMTRVLAGPACTQILGDLGAEVIKVERPGVGDDTRKWGPPYLKDAGGRETTESAYYLAINRNKRSITLDITKPEGQELALGLIEHCDVLIENFKVGDLARRGLAYEQLRQRFPRLVYCSITGFGQTGPYKERPGYDYLAQAMGGIMSVTGDVDGRPMKVGVAIADIMTGMYATTAILAALRHRDATGAGQHIDMALFDSQLAWLANVGQGYLISGEEPPRLGNDHPTVVPYGVFGAADGPFVLGVGNDAQFRRFCEFSATPELADDKRFATNASRVRNRAALIPLIEGAIARHPMRYWIEGLKKVGVPAAPINTVAQAFADPQAKHRGMVREIDHPLSDKPLPMTANPIRMSRTPVEYRHAPPTLGQDTEGVLADVLGIGAAEVAELRKRKIV